MAKQRLNGIGVWFSEEIENALRGIDAANLSVAQHIDTSEMKMYRLGYEAAIEAMAAVFGIRYIRPNGQSLPQQFRRE